MVDVIPFLLLRLIASVYPIVVSRLDRLQRCLSPAIS
jgi:hypothetical protein